MDERVKVLLETMSKEPGVSKSSAEWARIAWPTAFVCKRSGKEKAPTAVANALRKAESVLKELSGHFNVYSDWSYNEEEHNHRRVYGRTS